MAKGSFKCPSCDRTFSMAAHLVRHQNASHKRGPGRPKGSGKGIRRGRVGRPPKSQAMEMNFDDGSRVLSEMQAYRDTLLMQRSSIDQRLEGLESAMSAMGSPSIGSSIGRPAALKGRRGPGRPPGSGARRGRKPGREGSLKQMIVKVLRQRAKPHTPQEIADSVVKAGYKTSSSNLTKSVSNTLPLLSEVKKVGRGLYQA